MKLQHEVRSIYLKTNLSAVTFSRPPNKAHVTDIFSLAATPAGVLSASGSSTLHIHATNDPAFPLAQSLDHAHKLGCHHVAVSRNGKVAASAGFGGEVRIWRRDADLSGAGAAAAVAGWEPFGDLDTSRGSGDGSSSGAAGRKKNAAGEVWAVALSEDGRFLAATTYDGRINVWDVSAGGPGTKIQEYETAGASAAGSFGLCVDLSLDGKYTASGHQSGAVYVFNNQTGRLQYSLPGKS